MNNSNNEIRRKSKLALGLTWALLAASLALAGQARAADDQDLREAEMEAREAEAETRIEESERRLEQAELELDRQASELDMQLEEAQLRLEEAARQVAELSAQLVGDATVIALGSLRSIGEPRAMLGVNIAAAGEDGNAGVLVQGVTPGSPADGAEIQAGDVLVEIDGKSLEGGESGSGVRTLSEHMKTVELGQEVVLGFVRDGKEQSVALVPENLDPMQMVLSTTGDWDFDFEGLEDLERLEVLEGLEELEALGHRGEGGPHSFRFRMGRAEYWGDMDLVSLTPELGEYFGADEGILVVRAPDEEALQLQDGDVIVDIDGRKPGDPAHAMRILRSYDSGEMVKLGVVRKKKKRTLEIELPTSDLGAWDPANMDEGGSNTERLEERHIVVRKSEST